MKIYLIELRRRIIAILLFFLCTFFLSYFFSKNLYQLLIIPLKSLDLQENFIYTHLFEAFFTYLKTAFIAACIATIPCIFLQIYLFASPALIAKEKKIFIFYTIFSLMLFITSILLVYFYIIPIVWGFFLSFQSESLQFLPKINEYLSVTFTLFTGFAIMFQMPLILIFLANLKIIDAKILQKWRKIVVIAIFILAAFLTPPDIFSQVLLAIPMMILYEMTILIIKFMQKKI